MGGKCRQGRRACGWHCRAERGDWRWLGRACEGSSWQTTCTRRGRRAHRGEGSRSRWHWTDVVLRSMQGVGSAGDRGGECGGVAMGVRALMVQWMDANERRDGMRCHWGSQAEAQWRGSLTACVAREDDGEGRWCLAVDEAGKRTELSRVDGCREGRRRSQASRCRRSLANGRGGEAVYEVAGAARRRWLGLPWARLLYIAVVEEGAVLLYGARRAVEMAAGAWSAVAVLVLQRERAIARWSCRRRGGSAGCRGQRRMPVVRQQVWTDTQVA